MGQKEKKKIESSNAIIVRRSKGRRNGNKILKRKSSVKEVSEAGRRERNKRKKDGKEGRKEDGVGGKGPGVSMETESHQLTPCFPLVPPTTNSLPFPSQPVHLSITSTLHLIFPQPSSSSLCQDHTFDTFLSHTSASQHPSLFTPTTPSVPHPLIPTAVAFLPTRSHTFFYLFFLFFFSRLLRQF